MDLLYPHHMLVLEMVVTVEEMILAAALRNRTVDQVLAVAVAVMQLLGIGVVLASF